MVGNGMKHEKRTNLYVTAPLNSDTSWPAFKLEKRKAGYKNGVSTQATSLWSWCAHCRNVWKLLFCFKKKLYQRGAPEFNNCIHATLTEPQKENMATIPHMHLESIANFQVETSRVKSHLGIQYTHSYTQTFNTKFQTRSFSKKYIYKPNNPSINHMVADTPTDPNIHKPTKASRPQDQYGHAPAQPSPPRLRVLAMPSVARGSIVPGVWLRSARLVGRRELSWLLIDVNWWLRIRDFLTIT